MDPCPCCGGTHPRGTSLCPVAQTEIAAGGPCGTRVDRYEVLRWIAGGGMGAVYRARHAMTGHAVALKLLRPQLARDADVLGRFMREARAAASIGNPHIVQVFDFGLSPEGTAFLAMELLEGQSLESLLDSQGALNVGHAIALCDQLLDGLGAAHAAGVIHRDVKPANVLLVPQRDGTERVKILDFGISKVLESDRDPATALTRTGMVLGTPYYMAPEQFHDARTVDARTDLYSVAVIVYQMLAGVLPYRATSYQELLARVLTESPRPLREAAPSVPAPLADVVNRGMARDPNARFPSAQAFASALREAARVVPPQTVFAIAAHTAPSGSAPPAWSAPAVTPSHPSTLEATRASQNAVTPAPFTPHTPPFRPAPTPFAPMTVATPPRTSVAPMIAAALGAGALLVVGAILGLVVWLRDPGDAPPEMPPALPAVPPLPSAGNAWPAAQNRAPQPSAMLPIAAAAGLTGVSIDNVVGIGGVNTTVAQATLERIRPQLESCRIAGQLEHVVAQAIVDDDGTVPIAQVGPMNTGDSRAAQCVANAFQSAAPIAGIGSGILQITVSLAAR